MSDDKHTTEVDEHVAKAYRASANETVPQHLNDRVLNMAANPSRTPKRPFSLLSAWSKPLAWAATLALSLVIVLEVTQLSDLTDSRGTSTPTVESVRDDFLPRDTATLDRARDRAHLQNGPSQEFACAAATRETAVAWYACIDALRTSGRSHDAAQEFESFARKYPDFLPDK